MIRLVQPGASWRLLAALALAMPLAAAAGPTQIHDSSGLRWSLQQQDTDSGDLMWTVEHVDAKLSAVAGFGRGGRAPVRLGEDGDTPSGLRVDAQRRVWVYGASMDTGPSQAVVLRLLPNGQPDAAWGKGGRSVSMPGGLEGRATDVLPLPDGSALVAGNVVNDDGDDQAALWRLNADGGLDSAFESRGVWRRPGTGFSNASAVALADKGLWGLAVVMLEGRDLWVEVYTGGPGQPLRFTLRERMPPDGAQEVGLNWEAGRWTIRPADTVAQAPAAVAGSTVVDATPTQEIGQVGLSPFAGASAAGSDAPTEEESPFAWAALAGALVAAAGWFLLRRRDAR